MRAMVADLSSGTLTLRVDLPFESASKTCGTTLRADVRDHAIQSEAYHRPLSAARVAPESRSSARPAADFSHQSIAERAEAPCGLARRRSPRFSATSSSGFVARTSLDLGPTTGTMPPSWKRCGARNTPTAVQRGWPRPSCRSWSPKSMRASAPSAAGLHNTAEISSTSCERTPLAPLARRDSRGGSARVHGGDRPATYVVRPAGLEPATPGLGNRCSILLSYGRSWKRDVSLSRLAGPHRWTNRRPFMKPS